MNENKELEKAKKILLSDEYSHLFENFDINSTLNKIKICANYSEYASNQKNNDTILLLPDENYNRIINEVLKNVSSDIQVEKKVEFSKDKISKSAFSSIVPKEKIDEAFKNIYICKDEEEFYNIYGGSKKEELIEGFNRNKISYLKNDSTPHVVIHEILHTLSSTFDEEGHRIKNGICGKDTKGFGNSLNEGLTDYLAKKISNEESLHYKKEREFFERFAPVIQKSYGDENILERMYISNNDKLLKDFFDKNSKILSGADLYSKFLVINDQTFDAVFKEVSKNVEKKAKKEEFAKNHPKLSTLLTKIKNAFSKNKDESIYLNPPLKDITNADSFENNLKNLTFNNEEVNLNEKELENENVVSKEKNKEKVI